METGVRGVAAIERCGVGGRVHEISADPAGEQHARRHLHQPVQVDLLVGVVPPERGPDGGAGVRDPVAAVPGARAYPATVARASHGPAAAHPVSGGAGLVHGAERPRGAHQRERLPAHRASGARARHPVGERVDVQRIARALAGRAP